MRNKSKVCTRTPHTVSAIIVLLLQLERFISRQYEVH